MKTLQAERLPLRTLEPTDVPVLWTRVFSEPDAMASVFAGQALARGDTEAFVAANFAGASDPTGLAPLCEKAAAWGRPGDTAAQCRGHTASDHDRA